ncbi:prion-inhibition and propagation-domain-containing protein [Delphinella strobiligena]|nr:prion-inhibition and propagation-domain-containing protein [Delphinella strobiligena]
MPAVVQDNDALVASIVALASLFHNTVQCFGNIHSRLKDENYEKMLLVQLGLEQARLLIWGDLVGIFSPPAALAAQSGALAPDTSVTRAHYTRPRDERLEEDVTRSAVDAALTTLINTLATPTEEAIASAKHGRPYQNGLVPWQKGYAHALDQPAVNSDRLDAFNERYQLLLEVANERSGIAKPHRTPTTQWLIHDTTRFSNYVKSIKAHVDTLINTLRSNDEVERVMIEDIKALGQNDGPTKTPRYLAKLSVLVKASKGRYPGVQAEARTSLSKLQAESRGSEPIQSKNLLEKITIPGTKTPSRTPAASRPGSPTNDDADGDGPRRPSLISRLSNHAFKSFSGKRTPGHSTATTPASSRPASRPGSPEPVSAGTKTPKSPGDNILPLR